MRSLSAPRAGGVVHLGLSVRRRPPHRSPSAAGQRSLAEQRHTPSMVCLPSSVLEPLVAHLGQPLFPVPMRRLRPGRSAHATMAQPLKVRSFPPYL